MYSFNILTKLSNSEFELLKCIYHGMTSKKIAELRYVSIGTIKTQIHSILHKFGMKSMKDIIRKLDEINFSSLLDTLLK
ncbi:MAG: helix-turn-helix transcriptional regulator [Clostridiales bacterium]|nr:helix-turn-helix transcriptional regulator [Clostridiales bacterium]